MKFFTFAGKAAGAILVTAACALSASAQSISNINVEQSRAMQNKGALLLDVREPYEYAEGHAPGSVLIPLGQLNNRVNEIANSKNKPVVVICRSGRRSEQAAGILNRLGFKSVYNIEGGMLAWEKAGLPVKK